MRRRLTQFSPKLLPRLAVLLAITGCAPVPVFETQAPQIATEPPPLLPIEQVLAMAQTGQLTVQSGDALAHRAAGLRARAAAMRGPVMDPATRARLMRAASSG